MATNTNANTLDLAKGIIGQATATTLERLRSLRDDIDTLIEFVCDHDKAVKDRLDQHALLAISSMDNAKIITDAVNNIRAAFPIDSGMQVVGENKQTISTDVAKLHDWAERQNGRGMVGETALEMSPVADELSDYGDDGKPIPQFLGKGPA